MWGIFVLDTVSNTTTEAVNSLSAVLPLIISLMVISLIIGIFTAIIKKMKLQ